MKTTKKVIAVALTVVMVATLFAVLAACGNTFNVNWDNYLLDSAEYADVATSKLPTSVSTVPTSVIPGDATVNTAYANYGFVLVETQSSAKFGYSITKDKTFGAGRSLSEIYVDKIVDGLAITFIGIGGSNDFLYDINGNEVIFARSIDTEVVQVNVDGETVKYLEITAEWAMNTSQTRHSYRKIHEDGTLEDAVSELPESSLPHVGESITKATITLGEWLDLNVLSYTKKKVEDATLKEITVITTGNTTIFYKGGKQLSAFTKPIYLDTLTYADGKLLYTTLTPVDTQATGGFNFVDGSDKYNSQIFSFDVKSGKTKELSANYVIENSNTYALFNQKTEKFDLLAVSAYRMVDGVAYKSDESADIIAINNKGAVGFSALDSVYGMPICKLGKNYLTSTNNVINPRGKLVASLGNASIKAILEDCLVVTIGNKVATVDFNGIVKTQFTYTLEGGVYGHYAYVTDDDDKEMILDFNTGKAKILDEMCGLGGNNGWRVTGYLMREGSGSDYSWYLLDGTSIVKHTQSPSLYVYRVTVDNQTYGFATCVTSTDSTQCFRFAF